MKKSLEKNKNIIFGVGALILVIIILIVAIPNNKQEPSTTQTGTQPPAQDNAQTSTKTNVPETAVKDANNDVIVYSDSKLCENHVLSQKEEVILDGRKISVTKIGPTSIRVAINEKDSILSEGASVFFDGIKVELLSKKLLYFGNDDEDNSVELKIGCNKNEDPTEKHILSTLNIRGERICEALIKSCELEFGLR